MSRALVIQNSADDPPGRLADWLIDAGIELDLVRPHAGEPLPAGLEGHDALVVLGGPQSAYDDNAPWLGAVRGLLREAVGIGLPTLAVCLGAQLLAQATGGFVEPGEQGPEIGARLVAKRDVAAADPLFGPVPFTPDVIQWHFDDIVELPAGATLLASSTTYPHQAFRVGSTAYALQFHIETDETMVRRWAEEGRDQLAALGIDVDRVVERAVDVHPDLEEVWQPFTARFAEMVDSR